MNGIHDMGGMDGFGAVGTEDDARFHADWERLVFGIDKTLKSEEIADIDEKRHAVERIAPAEYLSKTYFERWLAALETLLDEKDIVPESELETRTREHENSDEELTIGQPDGQRDEMAARVREAFARPSAFDRPSQEPQFASGDSVRVRNIHPKGHTRCPEYVRRSTGRIESVQGTYVYPDVNAHGEEEARPLYTVAFDAEELWGPDAERLGDTIHVDLWEPYLESTQSEDNNE